MRLLIAAGLLVVAVVGCQRYASPPPGSGQIASAPAPFQRPPVTETVSGGGVGYQGFWIGGPNSHRDGKGPGISYSTVTVPKGEPRLVYVILFRYPEPYDSFGTGEGNGIVSDGTGQVTIQDGREINGKSLILRVDLFADEKSGQVTREELQVAKEKLDPAKGRLVLMDYLGEEVTWKQVDVDLKKTLEGIDVKDARRMGEEGVAKIREATPAVDEFFK